MKYNSSLSLRCATFLLLLITIPQRVSSQQSIQFGIHANPLFGWFNSNNSNVTGKGVHTGFNFGLTVNKYFHENYAFSTGLSLITAGGSISNSEAITLDLNNPIEVLPGNRVTYKVKYLAIPVGIRLKSNEIGYFTIFTDLGFDPKITLGGKAEIPSQHIYKENANHLLKSISMGYHIIGGIEYSLGGTTSVVLGLNLDNNFTDIIKEKGNQPSAKITHKMLGIHLGLNF